MEELRDILLSLFAALPGLLSLLFLRRKNEADTKKLEADAKKSDAETLKAEAETESLHAQVADKWAQHVVALQKRAAESERLREEDHKEITALRLDISQVRRENELYRQQLAERDQIITDLKTWSERLVKQLHKIAPDVQPELYIGKSLYE